MKKRNVVFLLAFTISVQVLNAQNPLFRHIYAADPSAHVWPSDTNTLWLYTSHDVPGTKVDLTSQLFEVFEGPWVHKYNRKYYLSYPDLPKGQWPEEMYYAISEKPLGPYQYKGIYIPGFKGRSGTNHGAIIKCKGNWLAFHHSAWLSGGMSEVRNLMADYLFYNPDGTIKPIVPDSLGLLKGKPNKVIIMLEAENGKASGGRLNGTETVNNNLLNTH